MIFNVLDNEIIIKQIITLLQNHPTLSPSLIHRIRKMFPQLSQEEIKILLDIGIGTIHASQSHKFSDTFSNWLFTKQTYEQSTSEQIAHHHALRFSCVKSILEICTGAGIDTNIFSRNNKSVTTIESNMLIADLACRNFKQNNLNTITLIRGKAEDILIDRFDYTKFDGVWADPSRRNITGKRISISEKDYLPNLNWIMSLPVARIMGIKVSSALNIDNLPSGWVREWIGLNNECKEQILWKNSDICEGTVSIIDKHTSWFPQNKRIKPLDIVTSLNLAFYLVEPHPSLIRCGYLAEFYDEYSIGLFDYRIGYGITESKPPISSLYSVFEIIEQFDFNYKHLQSRLNELQWNKGTEIKKRGFPWLPDEVRKKLTFSNSDECGVIILSQKDNQKIVFLAKRVV